MSYTINLCSTRIHRTQIRYIHLRENKFRKVFILTPGVRVRLIHVRTQRQPDKRLNVINIPKTNCLSVGLLKAKRRLTNCLRVRTRMRRR